MRKKEVRVRRILGLDVDLAAKLWSGTRIDETTGCWVWQHGRDSSGYGRIYWREDGQRKTDRTHRIAWRLTHEGVGFPEHLMHRCDNKQCCNPDHIIAGTHAENMADAAKKGLMHPGSQHGMAKLMEAQVLEIRALWKSGEWRQREIAERFGISASSVSTIINRKNWTHI